MIRAIVAVDEKWGIGKKNDLLFHLPEDMKFFKQKTLNSTVCMGYNTLLSFPGGKPPAPQTKAPAFPLTPPTLPLLSLLPLL